MFNHLKLNTLSNSLEGTLLYDELNKTIYSTDASVYKIKPIAVALPKTVKDIITLIRFAAANKIALTPRTAGTSLAGQTVGSGIIVDVSKHFTKIVSFDAIQKTVTVQPGVIRDELNLVQKIIRVVLETNSVHPESHLVEPLPFSGSHQKKQFW